MPLLAEGARRSRGWIGALLGRSSAVDVPGRISDAPGRISWSKTEPERPREPGRFLSRCGNPRCSTGWIRLWRSRKVPCFEGRWACSPQCMAELVLAAVRREGFGGDVAPSSRYVHRIPLGLTLLEQGYLSHDQLREALGHQRETTGAAPLGRWLVESGVLSETVLTRALGTRWGCPLLPLDDYRPEEVATAMPRFLSELVETVPVRVSGDRLLYLAFAGDVDRSLSYAMERVLGLRVMAGVARDSEFRAAQARYAGTPAPRARLLEASESRGLAQAIARLIETEKPAEARLARVHECCWLRLWKSAPEPAGLPARSAVEDVLCMIGRGWRDRQ